MDKLSSEVKNATFAILEPDLTKRWKIEQLVNSEWIRMDPRLTSLTIQEKNALQNAHQAMSMLLDRGSKAQQHQVLRLEGRNGTRVTNQNVQNAVNNAAAGYSQVTVIKNNEPNLTSSKMENLYQSEDNLTQINDKEKPHSTGADDKHISAKRG